MKIEVNLEEEQECRITESIDYEIESLDNI